jgi:hypothetical protein
MNYADEAEQLSQMLALKQDDWLEACHDIEVLKKRLSVTVETHKRETELVEQMISKFRTLYGYLDRQTIKQSGPATEALEFMKSLAEIK